MIYIAHIVGQNWSGMNDLISRQDAINELYKINPSEDMLFVDAIVDMLENLPEKSERKWISCSERLPGEEKQDYLVYTDTGYQCQCRWTNDVYGFGVSDRWNWKIFDIPQYQKVVAWMPLVEPRENNNE